MTDPDTPLAPDPAPATLEPSAEPPAPRRPWLQRDSAPWLVLLGFVVLAIAIAAVGWSAAQRRQAQSAQWQALADRVAQLEQRPASQPAQLAPLEARVAALEQREAPDLAPLRQRMAALEKQGADTGQLGSRMDALSAQIATLAGRDQNAEGSLLHRLDSDEARLTALEQATTAMAAKANQAARLARIEAAQAALASGKPLGNVPGAPQAVARFAAAAPPTEAALRLAFPHAAQAALAASQPDTEGKALLGRMLNRAEDLVTVRQGDRVLLGNPATGVLARARDALDAGDLAGAVAAVSQLSGPPAAAMADWLTQAKALLAARTGLADMAAHA